MRGDEERKCGNGVRFVLVVWAASRLLYLVCGSIFARVVPNLTGAELIFSLFFPEDTEPAAVDAQMAVVDEELRAVRAHVER